jgi:hypothetical protein
MDLWVDVRFPQRGTSAQALRGKRKAAKVGAMREEIFMSSIIEGFMSLVN